MEQLAKRLSEEQIYSDRIIHAESSRAQRIVVTRWRDEDAFNAWVSSPAFAHGHAGADKPSPHGGPVSVASELWSYEVAGGSSAQ